jgi:hypothetical protein
LVTQVDYGTKQQALAARLKDLKFWQHMMNSAVRVCEMEAAGGNSFGPVDEYYKAVAALQKVVATGPAGAVGMESEVDAKQWIDDCLRDHLQRHLKRLKAALVAKQKGMYETLAFSLVSFRPVAGGAKDGEVWSHANKNNVGILEWGTEHLLKVLDSATHESLKAGVQKAPWWVGVVDKFVLDVLRDSTDE